MDDNLLENAHLETYDSTNTDLDNICVICLESLRYIPLLSPPSEICSDADSCDTDTLVDIELASINSSRENSETEYWTCNNCTKTYHLHCIYDWAKNKTTFNCPTCRQKHTLDIIIVDTNDIALNSNKVKCIQTLVYTVVTFILSFAVLLILKILFMRYT